MPLANPDPAHAEKPPGVSTPDDDPPASVDNATAEDKSSSDSGTDS